MTNDFRQVRFWNYYVTVFWNLILVIALRVQSYHDTLKYNETIISDFIERAQKQLFKFKTFLIGLATLFDHHKESFDFRTNQWTEEWEVRSFDSTDFEESKFSSNQNRLIFLRNKYLSASLMNVEHKNTHLRMILLNIYSTSSHKMMKRKWLFFQNEQKTFWTSSLIRKQNGLRLVWILLHVSNTDTIT